MSKAARIKAFVELERTGDVLSVKKCSPLFEKLLRNVRNEYKMFHENREPKINNQEVDLNSSNESSDHAGYLRDQNFINAFAQLREKQELPFSITHEIRCNNPAESEHFVFPSQHIRRTSYFVSSSVSSETFHQIQRQHKIFWMRNGAGPGKYSISDQKSESFHKFVNIRSSADESLMDVEQLKLFSLKDCIKDKEVLANFLSRVPNRKKEVIPDVIESVVDLQVASFALLMDAVNLSDDYTAFHRRSAPYQLALVIDGVSKNLIDLARYIELLLRATEPQIEILNESAIKVHSKAGVGEQFAKFDKIGIPYAIVLDEKALESGLFKLRSRNTTLSETIHLSDVTNYLIKIFNSG